MYLQPGATAYTFLCAHIIHKLCRCLLVGAGFVLFFFVCVLSVLFSCCAALRVSFISFQCVGSAYYTHTEPNIQAYKEIRLCVLGCVGAWRE